MTHIWYQSNTSFESLGAYRDALDRHANRILPEGVRATFHGLPAALYGNLLPGEVLSYPYLKHMIQDAALEACYEAERQGADAFVIGSFSEPLLKQSRSAVDIPVASLPESALLIGCSIAERIALITLSAKQSRRVEEIIERHRLEHRVAGCFDLGGRFSERDLERSIEAPASVLAAFSDAASRAIAAGADVLIPAEGILNEVVYFSGTSRIGRASVMDCVGVVLLHVEMMVRARRVLKLDVGREWSYPRANSEVTAAMRVSTGRNHSS